MLKLYPHQTKVLSETAERNKVAYYLDMGLGKTYVGSEKLVNLHEKINLVVCQKSKVDDWVNHFEENYSYTVYDLTVKSNLEKFVAHDTAWAGWHGFQKTVGIINYDLLFRRPELANLENFTLLLDESSLITNPTAKRTKFILKKLKPKNVILLSGTPTSGKYELLWSQLNLLGWNISKDLYYKQYVDVDNSNGYPVIKGYKNVERLKGKMRAYGCVFMKTEEVIDLPEQRFIDVNIEHLTVYKKFMKDCYVKLNNVEFIGDTTLTKLLRARQLCGAYNDKKIEALKDLIESTENRLIIFYNFNEELEKIQSVIPENRHISIVNGNFRDLNAYENYDDSVTIIQYQAGSMGLNLQKANVIVYFSPTLSSEQFEQSKKRIHRIGQKNNCLYYKLICGIEKRIYEVLDMRKDYTDKLFEEDDKK